MVKPPLCFLVTLRERHRAQFCTCLPRDWLGLWSETSRTKYASSGSSAREKWYRTPAMQDFGWAKTRYGARKSYSREISCDECTHQRWWALDAASVEVSLSMVFLQCSGRQTQTSGKALISPLAGGDKSRPRPEVFETPLSRCC